MSEQEWAVPLTTVEVSEPDVQAVMECLESGWLTVDSTEPVPGIQNTLPRGKGQ